MDFSSVDKVLLQAKAAHEHVLELGGHKPYLAGVIYVAGATLVLVLLRLLLGACFGGKGGARRGKQVLLVGPCGAGKTALLHALCRSAAVDTVTSMRPSSLSIHADGTPDATDGSSKGSVTVTDFPGHERLRGGLRGELATSTAVIFMLDGTDLSSQVRLGGEMLYDILTDSSIERCKGLAIGCSKADLKVAKPDRVRAALTKELEQLRTTRWSIGMQGEEDTGRPNSFIPLGRQGQPLDLVVDCPCPLTVFTCSVKGEGLNAVRDFIAGCFE